MGWSRTKHLGNSGIEVSAMGLGCWAIGGPFWEGDMVLGWGDVDDDESIRAIHCALDMGVYFFDTSDVYGAGHSEIVLGRALKGRRREAVIATKFGYTFDARTRQKTGADASPDYIRKACEASLRRLGTDYIDLYQFHQSQYPADKAHMVVKVLEELIQEGKIRTYGWSTRTPDRAAAFAKHKNCSAIQYPCNVLQPNKEMLAVCESYNVAAIARTPLAMGLLTGKFTERTKFEGNDVRGINGLELDYFEDGKVRSEWLERVGAKSKLFIQERRTLAQNAIAWLLDLSESIISIPGFKTLRQVQENCSAIHR